MKKSVFMFSIILGILMLSFISAASQFSIGDFLDEMGGENLVLIATFIISFGLIFFSLSRVLKDRRTGEPSKSIAGIIAFALALLITYGINKTGFDIEELFFSIGVSEEILAYAIPLIVIVGIIYLFIKLKSWTFLILGIGLIVLSFTDYIYEKSVTLILGVILVIIGLVWKWIKKKRRLNYERGPRGPGLISRAVRGTGRGLAGATKLGGRGAWGATKWGAGKGAGAVRGTGRGLAGATKLGGRGAWGATKLGGRGAWGATKLGGKGAGKAGKGAWEYATRNKEEKLRRSYEKRDKKTRKIAIKNEFKKQKELKRMQKEALRINRNKEKVKRINIVAEEERQEKKGTKKRILQKKYGMFKKSYNTAMREEDHNAARYNRKKMDRIVSEAESNGINIKY